MSIDASAAIFDMRCSVVAFFATGKGDSMSSLIDLCAEIEAEEAEKRQQQQQEKTTDAAENGKKI